MSQVVHAHKLRPREWREILPGVEIRVNVSVSHPGGDDYQVETEIRFRDIETVRRIYGYAEPLGVHYC